MTTVSRFVLNSALMLSSMSGIGCAVMTPQWTACRECEDCELKMNTARLEELKGNYEIAKRQYSAVHKKFPQNSECLHRLAKISTEQKHLDEADAYYRQAYQLNPNNPELLGDMGYAAFLKKDYENAEMFLEKSVLLNGRDQAVVNNLGVTRGWMQKDGGSLAAFRMIYGEAEAIRQLAAIQASRGDVDRSRKNLELADRIDSPRANEAPAIAQFAADSTRQKFAEATRPVEVTSNPPAAPNDPLVSIKVPVLTIQPAKGCAPQEECRPADLFVESEKPATIDQVSLRLNLPQPLVSVPPASCAAPDGAPRTASEEPIEVLVETSLEVAEDIAVTVQSEEKPDELGLPEDWGIEVDRPSVAKAVDAAPQAEFQVFSAPQPVTVWRKVLPPEVYSVPSEFNAPLINSNVSKILQASVESRPVDDCQPGLKGICLVSLVEGRKVAQGLAEFTAEFQSQKYCFSSLEARDKFCGDPLKYVPVAGGLDVVSVRKGNVVEQGAIEFAVWYRGQLYLFTCAEHAEAFRRTPRQYATAE